MPSPSSRGTLLIRGSGLWGGGGRNSAPGVTPGHVSSLGVPSVLNIRASSSSIVEPGNSGLPAAISKKMQPTPLHGQTTKKKKNWFEHISLEFSSRTCSLHTWTKFVSITFLSIYFFHILTVWVGCKYCKIVHHWVLWVFCREQEDYLATRSPQQCLCNVVSTFVSLRRYADRTPTLQSASHPTIFWTQVLTKGKDWSRVFDNFNPLL